MTTNKNNTKKIAALVKHLGCETSEIRRANYSDSTYEHGICEYLIYTDSEADKACKESILDSAWAFNTSFISDHMRAPLNGEGIKAFAEMQNKLCESANAIVLAVIRCPKKFVKDAISADGRGHFLAGYDHNETEAGRYFIYRIN